MVTKIVGLLYLSLLLGSCGTQGEEQSQPPLSVSGGKSATVAIGDLAKAMKESPRPSGTLGIFSAIYLAQGTFLPTNAGAEGVMSVLTLLKNQERPLTDETYVLLEQLGSTLSVNVVDMLNRSSDRSDALDRYTEALTNIAENGQKKLAELTASLTTLKERERSQRLAVRDAQKIVNDALRQKDYQAAGSKQEEVNMAQSALAETELALKQTNDTLVQFKKFLDLTKKRLAAVQSNRAILLSGLTINDIAGLKDLGLVKDSKNTTGGGGGLFTVPLSP